MPPKANNVKKTTKKKSLYKKPCHLPQNTILTDGSRNQWKIGKSIGTGGFGEIYSACKADATIKNVDDYPFVVKIEPHGNGPLFVEMHFYMRNGKLEESM